MATDATGVVLDDKDFRVTRSETFLTIKKKGRHGTSIIITYSGDALVVTHDGKDELIDRSSTRLTIGRRSH